MLVRRECPRLAYDGPGVEGSLGHGRGGEGGDTDAGQDVCVPGGPALPGVGRDVGGLATLGMRSEDGGRGGRGSIKSQQSPL